MDDQRHILRIKKIIPETQDCKSFVLEPVAGAQIPYIPGQFLTLLFQNRNGEEQRRNYSITSYGDALMITVKRIPNGEYSRKLVDDAKEGDTLNSIGASGFFTLPGEMHVYNSFVFFAAGSGITPIYALIKQILYQYPGKKIVLIYSNRSLSQTIFYDALKELQSVFPGQLQIEFLFSDASGILHKRLGIYLLEKLLGRYVGAHKQDSIFYLCGPFEYMRMITIVLRNNGIVASQIRKEIFTIEVPANKPQPADTDLHTVQISLKEHSYVFRSQYPNTILQSAKQSGIILPYSCEAGQCGTCAATCVSGKVWMWRNDVLMDDEIAKGRILTCTGYAIDGDVVILY